MEQPAPCRGSRVRSGTGWSLVGRAGEALSSRPARSGHDPGQIDWSGPGGMGGSAGSPAGLLLRRTVPAIVTAFVAFLAVRLPVEFWLRRHYQSPVTRLVEPTANMTMDPTAVPTSPGAPGWILSQNRTISRYSRRTNTSAENRRPDQMPWRSYGTAQAGTGIKAQYNDATNMSAAVSLAQQSDIAIVFASDN